MSVRKNLALGLLALVVLSAIAPAASAQSAGDIFPYKVHETTLDNGLQVVVIP